MNSTLGNIATMLKTATPLLLLMISCTSISPSPEDVSRVIDRWHDAASRADEATYLGLMADDAIFLGTDGGERWSRQEFAEFVHPYFSQGRGWTYVASDRHIYFDPAGRLAWFEEKLGNEKYGQLRGTGVMRLTAEGWRLVHYSMSFPVPNEKTAEVVQLIQGVH